MAPFVYNANKTQASVKFQAYKFPYTASIYYQCNIRLCLRDGACEEVHIHAKSLKNPPKIPPKMTFNPEKYRNFHKILQNFQKMSEFITEMSQFPRNFHKICKITPKLSNFPLKIPKNLKISLKFS